VKEWVELEQAIQSSGLKDGDRISLHHHLRMGDRIVTLILPILSQMKYKNLILSASSLLGPACEAVLTGIKKGTIAQLETTGLKPPLSTSLEKGDLGIPVIFRSHGGRALSISSGKSSVNLAFLAVSAADRAGNGNGTQGPNRFGSLGYGLVDARWAEKVILLTDTILEEGLKQISIPSEQVDHMVKIPQIGVRKEITGGSLRTSVKPLESLIAHMALELLVAGGMIKEGFNFQAGSGGISLKLSSLVAQYMREHHIQGGFASGGVTASLVKLLQEGLFQTLYDVQSFDDEASFSLGQEDQHIEMSASRYANPDYKDCIAHQLDVMILSATEVDCNFNVNSLTGSDGRFIGALGGAPDTAEGSKITMVVIPSFRARIPSIRKKVHTVCTEGKYIDLIVTERGFSVNPNNKDLMKKLENQGLHPVPIESLMNKVHEITGVPQYPIKTSQKIAVVEDRHGNLLDTIYKSDSF
jgi:citrate lyase subunit alpha / citrate CoA-transferase